MSLCDRCAKPGACCDALPLIGSSNLDHAETPLEALAIVASTFHPTQFLPFIPNGERQDGHWLFSCPVLDRQTGRCSDYAYRPPACSEYPPAYDKLCVHYARPNCGLPTIDDRVS